MNATRVSEHLICDGFLRSYTIWTWHDELIDIPIVFRTEHVLNSTMKERWEERCEERVEEDNMEDMIWDVGVEAFAQAHVYETMSADAETPLYVDSTKFTRLSVILRLMNLKATNGWTDKSFTELLVLE